MLDDVVLGGAVPGDAPAHRPAVAGAHRAAVAEFDAAVGRLAVVVEHAGGPALVRLGPAVAVERAVEQHDRSGQAAAGGGEPDVVGRHGAAVEQDLAAVGREFGRLGRAFVQRFAIDRHALERDPPAADADAVHRFVDHDVADPAVLAADAQGREVAAAEWLIGCGGDSMCRFSMPTCETPRGGRILTTAVPGGFRYFGVERIGRAAHRAVSVLPSMAAIRRSVVDGACRGGSRSAAGRRAPGRASA